MCQRLRPYPNLGVFVPVGRAAALARAQLGQDCSDAKLVVAVGLAPLARRQTWGSAFGLGPLGWGWSSGFGSGAGKAQAQARLRLRQGWGAGSGRG